MTAKTVKRFNSYKIIIEGEIEMTLLAKSAKAAGSIWEMIRRNNTRDYKVIKEA